MQKKNHLAEFLRRETVLCIALLLAAVSAVFVVPDREYAGYIDFRTLAILFSLMSVMAGLQKIGVFGWIAEKLLARVRTSRGIVLILVLLCFFFSMLITNDVALITFVPFTFTVLDLLGKDCRRRLVLPVVVMQTIAANLGSMLTPMGNPQNLYLYGKAGLSMGEFIGLMLPYTALSLVLLLAWAYVLGRTERGGLVEGERKTTEKKEPAGGREASGGKQRGMVEDPAGERRSCVKGESAGKGESFRQEKGPQLGKTAPLLAVYLLLFFFCLLAVGHLLPWQAVLAAVFLTVLAVDRKALGRVDYSLLLTFAGFFIFIGNMGRIAAFRDFLQSVVAGREVYTAIVASQAISNVPAALLLSGFTENYEALIVGTNLGGLGTLIASMASLISCKYVARQESGRKGEYIRLFTLANIGFLAALAGLEWAIRGL